MMILFSRWRSIAVMLIVILISCLIRKEPLIAVILDRTTWLLTRITGKLYSNVNIENNSTSDSIRDKSNNEEKRENNNSIDNSKNSTSNTIKDTTVNEPIKSNSLHKKSSSFTIIDKFIREMNSEFPELREETARKLFPRKYERHDHVLVIRLNEGANIEEMTKVAKCIAQSFEPVKIGVILCDKNGIHGELRVPILSLLYSDIQLSHNKRKEYLQYLEKRLKVEEKEANVCKIAQKECRMEKCRELRQLICKYCNSQTFALHVENSIKYYFDVSKVMFCSGNTTERMHFGTIDSDNEIIVDMFAGIGYFTLPLAKHCINSGSSTKIYAIEKNIESAELLKINSLANNVMDKIYVINGDNRLVGDQLHGKCDRVIMGYIPSCESFLPRAITFLKKNTLNTSTDETLFNNSTQKCSSKSKLEQEKNNDSNYTACPVGVIHYHFLSPKHQANTTVRLHLSRALTPEVLHHSNVTQIRCVKSYAPQLYHFVADIKFE